jgi:uncharacterized damage-inducible protein DinB
MTPEQATFLLRDIFLPSLKNEHSITKKVIGAIPSEKCDFHPDNVAKSAIELAWHIAMAEMRFLNAVAAGQFDLTPHPRPESIKNGEDLLKWYPEQFEASLAKLGQTSADQLTKVIDFRGVFQLPAVMYLNFILSHTIHHRGQLSMYLRPMGAKVPSIYGESWDATQARMAAAQV